MGDRKQIPWHEKAALSIPEAAAVLSMNRTTLWRLEKAGKLTVSRPGGIPRVTVEEIKRLLKAGEA